MCFSYAVNFNKDALQSRLQLEDIMLPESGFFFSGFTYPLLPVIVSQNQVLKSELKQWGLIPSWAKDEKQAEDLRKLGLNARGETVGEKPLFRSAFKKGRCIIPAAGFFEWREVNKKKYPYFIYPTKDPAFLFAGISDNWVNPETGEIVASYSIVTSPPNGLLSMIHNIKLRMPLILEYQEVDQWLHGEEKEAMRLVKPASENMMSAHTISKLASSPTNNRNIPEVQEEYFYPELENKTLF